MPQRRSGIKYLRKNRKNQMHNLDLKTDLRKTVKKFLAFVTQKNISEAQNLLKTIYKKFDKAAKRNILHKKTAAHRKSRLTKLLAQTK